MNKIISIPSERLWIYRCKENQECSICPFSMSQTSKENSGEIDKESEIGKHLLEGILENQTKYKDLDTLLFDCPKCNKKWAMAGEFSAEARLAHVVNKGESYEGSKLTCFACEKKN